MQGTYEVKSLGLGVYSIRSVGQDPTVPTNHEYGEIAQSFGVSPLEIEIRDGMAIVASDEGQFPCNFEMDQAREILPTLLQCSGPVLRNRMKTMSKLLAVPPTNKT